MTYPLRFPPTEHPVHAAEDLQVLRKQIEGLVGQPVLRADRLYGDEMCLEIGRWRPYESSLLADELQGSWQITTQASTWNLMDAADKTPVATDEDPAGIETVSHALEGTRIVSVELSYPDLALTVIFSNGWQIHINGSAAQDGEDGDLHNWVIFTDANRVVLAGPGRSWYSGTAD